MFVSLNLGSIQPDFGIVGFLTIKIKVKSVYKPSGPSMLEINPVSVA